MPGMIPDEGRVADRARTILQGMAEVGQTLDSELVAGVIADVTAEEDVPEGAGQRVHDALSRYRVAREDLDEWRREFAQPLRHIAECEADLEAAKSELLAAMTEATMDFAEDDSFAVTRVAPDRGAYDPAKLPPAAIAEAGNITIDRKTLERMVKRGELDRAVAAAAWTPAPTSPYLKVTVKTEGQE